MVTALMLYQYEIIADLITEAQNHKCIARTATVLLTQNFLHSPSLEV